MSGTTLPSSRSLSVDADPSVGTISTISLADVASRGRVLQADEMQLYMPLLGEGTEVWRPVEAEPTIDGYYRIVGEVPDEEAWTFAPGTIVRCEWRDLGDDRALVAVARKGG